MKQFIGISRNNNLLEAINGLINPELIILIVSDKDIFSQKVEELQKIYPNIPSIGCVGQSYGGVNIVEKGLTIIAFSDGIKAVTGIIKNVSDMPVKSIADIEKNFKLINANSNNTVCIDFCSSNDEIMLTTINSVLRTKDIKLTGGTAWEGLVSQNGIVYKNSCAYAFVQNQNGKIKVYKENLYISTDMKYVVTKAISEQNLLQELDNKPFAQVYKKALNIDSNKVQEQTFINPLGRCVGDEVLIVSLKELVNNSEIICYHKVSIMDILSILKLGDYKSIINDTISQIKHDFSHISGIFSFNCLFRYLLFQQKNYDKEYFKIMSSLGEHAGLIALGEHYNQYHINQTMSCVVFE